MKNLKMFCATIGILVLWYVLMSNSGNPNNALTGAPGQGVCANCHGGTTYNAGVVGITGVPASIMPSATYPVTLTAASTAIIGGFQLCVLDGANANCGTLASTSGDVFIDGTSIKYAEHSGAKSYSGGTVSWTFNWTAPASLTNNSIKFYFSSALCNSNGSSGGDTGKNSSFTGTLAAGAAPVSASILGTSNVTCNGGNNGAATATATGGTSPYTYAWSNGQNTQVATNLAAGNYTVTVTGGGQSGTATANITQPMALNLSTITNNSSLNCNNPTASITVAASGGTGGFQYAWSNGNTGPTLSTTTANNYTVTVTDGNFCTKTSTFTVSSNFTPPSVTATAANPVLGCGTASTTLSATGGVSYNWSNALGTSSSVSVSPTSTATYTVTAAGSNGCTATKTVTVTVDKTAPTLSVSANPSIVTCANPSIALSAAGNGSFAWSNGFTSSTFAQTPTSNTTYTVTLTAANGCTAAQSVSVTVDNTPPTATATAQPQTVNCTSPASTLSASGGIAYAWSNGLGSSATPNPVTPTANTTYTVTVTGSNGCSVARTITVATDKIAPTPDISASANTITCSNPSITLTAVGGNTYAWNAPTSTNPLTVAPTANTAYTVVATGTNGCTASATKTIDVNVAKPNISLTPKTATLTCTSASVPLSSASTTVGATFAWSGPNGFTATTANINAATPGKYIAKATNTNNGCSVVDSATVLQDANVPAVAANNGIISCKKTNATLVATSSVAGSTFAWSGPNNFTATSASTTTNVPGTYTVNVTAPNGCKAAANSVIANNTQPINITAGTDSKACTGIAAALKATSACTTCVLNYQWTNTGGSITSAANTAAITALGAGTYIVSVKDTISGCVGKDTVVVSNYQVPSAVATSSFVDCTPCVDIKASGAGAPYSYTWNNGSTLSKVCNVAAGNYTVTITTADGCKVTATTTANTPPNINVVLAKATNATIGQTNGAITIAVTGGSGTFTYAWAKSTSTQVIGTNKDISNLGVGIYVLTVKDSNGCTTTFTAEIKGVVGTEDIEANRYMRVFPNPNDGHFNINLQQVTAATLRILDTKGQLMLSKTLETENSIDLSALPKGMYFIQLRAEDKILVKRIVIE